MRKLVLFMVALAWIGAGAPGTPPAAEAATNADVELSDAELERRIGFIEEHLDASRRHAEIWYWSWLTINGGSMVGLSIASALTDKADARASFIPQAVLAAMGVADLTVIRPLEARLGADPIQALPDATREQRLRKLERAEALLQSNAERAADRWSWPLHLANLGVNAAAGIATWAAGTTSDALISFLSGTASGELYIWTEPSAPAQDWRGYEGSRPALPQLMRRAGRSL